MGILLQWFSSLPEPAKTAVIASAISVSGGLIVALIAFLGVFLTHLGNERRLRRQLAHDREERKRDREMELRKQIFLDAIEAVSLSVQVISRFSDLTLTPVVLRSQATERNATLAKLHLVGSENVIAALQDFVLDFNRSLTQLEMLRAPIDVKLSEAQRLHELAVSHEKQRARLIELMNQIHLGEKGVSADVGDRWAFAKAASESEFLAKQVAVKARTAIDQEVRAVLPEFLLAVADARDRLRLAQAVIVVAQRGELDMPINHAAYLSSVQSSVRKTREFVESQIQAYDQKKPQ